VVLKRGHLGKWIGSIWKVLICGAGEEWRRSVGEGRIEMTGRRGRRCMQLLDDLKEKRRYRKLKEEALDRTLWRTSLEEATDLRKTDCKINE
jgi:hypothetical protein